MAQHALAQANPYGAPRTALDDEAEDYQPVKLFSIAGRIGRARYILYSLGLPMLIMLITGLAAAFAGTMGARLMVVGWIAAVAISIMLTVQRCHDFDTTGWLALVMLIPLVNLVFWFTPGTDGRNRFGARTAPNSKGILIGVWIVPLVFTVGIVAAISIPAYQQYLR